jgi:hypothetical protein
VLQGAFIATAAQVTVMVSDVLRLCPL